MLRQKITLDYYNVVAVYALAIISGIIVAKIAGPTVLGVLAFGLSFASLFQFLADFGLGIAYIKLVSSGENLAKCNATFAIMKLFLLILFFFFVSATLLIQKYLFNFAFESQTHKYVTLIFILIVAVLSLMRIPIATFTAKMEIAKKNLPALLNAIGGSVSKIALVLLGFGALAISLSHLFIAALVAIFSFYLLKNYPFSSFDRKLAGKLLKIAFPAAGILVILNLVMHMDKVMLSYLANLKEVGYYAVGLRLSELLRLMGISLGTLLFPVMSGYVKKHNYAEIKNIIVKCEKFLYLFIMPPVIFIAIYSGTIIKVILGAQYAPSIYVLSIMVIAMFIALSAQPHRTLLFSAGFLKASTLLHLSYLIIFITAEYLFVSSQYFNLGAMGAALALLVANMFLFTVFRIFAARKIRQLKISFRILPVLYGIGNLIFFYFAYKYFFMAGGKLALAVFPIVYFLLTYLSLYGFGFLKKQDFKILKTLVNVKAMKDYTFDELFNNNTRLEG